VAYDVDVPVSWSKEQVRIHRNQSSWCANNALDELEQIEKKLGRTGQCFCGRMRFEVESLGLEVFERP
jgi:hypothetical protein